MPTSSSLAVAMLPITKVIIYKHGLAFFQHEGEVEENQSIEFFFKSRDMNDVLKSFTIIDGSDRRRVEATLSTDNNNSYTGIFRTHAPTQTHVPHAHTHTHIYGIRKA